MTFQVGAMTDTGRKRAQNQDNFISLPEFGFFMVADGMGGHQGGEIASRLAAETISQSIQKANQESRTQHPAACLTEAINLGNQSIYQLSANTPTLKGMGTTVTALLFHENQLWIGHVGDSRCYLLREDGFWQITRDHSLVEEKFRAGLINRAQMRVDPMKNVITRSVGFEQAVAVEIFSLEAHRNDVLLICSDGLSGQIEDAELFQILKEGISKNTSLQEIAHALIQEANRKGGDDNITSVVVQVT
jgi:protein phosphatase